MTGTAGAGAPARGRSPAVVALVRDVSPRLVDAERTFVAPTPIDLEVARRQHAGYVRLLQAGLGLRIVTAPPAPEHPDAVFVEDTVVVVDRLAVLTRPGATSRRGEVAGVRPALEGLGLPVATIEPPATLDGGDVLQLGRTVYVGRSRRTDHAGVEQLAGLLAPLGRRVVPVAVDGALHLKSAAAALPDGAILALPDRVDLDAFAGREVVIAPEASGANVLVHGDAAVVSAAAPATATLLRARGVRVATVAIGEFEKAEAGPTCLSVLLPLAAATIATT